MFIALLKLMRLHKPVGSILLLWPTLWALWVATEGRVSLSLFLFFVCGVIFTRSTGCVINDLADRGFDAQIQRTQERPLASGIVKIAPVLSLLVFLALLGSIFLVYLHPLARKVAIISVLLMSIYPFCKRYIVIPQIILGLAFSCSIGVVFAQVQNTLPFSAVFLYLANVFWTVGYDTAYALADKSEDKTLGLHSSAIFFGRYVVLALGLLYTLTLFFLGCLGYWVTATEVYYSCFVPVIFCFVYQLFLIKQGNTKNYLQAFANNQWVGAFIFLGIVLHYAI